MAAFASGDFMADSVAEVCVSAPVPSPLPLYDRLGPQETNGGSVGSSGRRPPREGSGLNSLVHQFTRPRMSADAAVQRSKSGHARASLDMSVQMQVGVSV